MVDIVPQVDRKLLQGFQTNDDAAVYMLREDLAVVLTVDYFTPMVDDPYQFGRIAAANALSDIYAMGAKPVLALNLLSLDSGLDKEADHKLSAAILKGGLDAVTEAGAIIAGGHTIDDAEPKYGLTVLGTINPSRVLRNDGARAGDLLYLTKPLGTGIMTSAFRVGQESEQSMREVIDSMMELNASAADALRAVTVHAVTDVTGFGLAGHLHEMLKGSGCSAELDWEAIPLFSGVLDHVRAYCRPARSFEIQEQAEKYVERGSLSGDVYDDRMGVLCDPQTSGGLLIALSPEEAVYYEKAYLEQEGRLAIPIGKVTNGQAGTIRFKDARLV
ncbi:MAG TPA: selenide, water dikinase SelD [Coriobacteriia bacterium]|nr:selenide, water dikinase SelD [Coriobacteriia bacterium]